MISTFTVLIDANVFFGARLRSLVLFLAQSKMFRARWSARIDDEWTTNVANKRGIEIERLQRTRDLIDQAVADCLVTGFEPLEPSFTGLPDPDDRHVLAAAMVARAELILTFNIADFPDDVIGPLGIETRHPDAFLQDLYHISDETFIEAVALDFAHYKKPALEFEEYVDTLRRAGVPETADLIASLRVVIESLTKASRAKHLPKEELLRIARGAPAVAEELLLEEREKRQGKQTRQKKAAPGDRLAMGMGT